MTETPRCRLCGERLGERRCPALDALICSTCCGTHRLKSISCPPSCPYLLAAERRRRARRARELGKAWAGFSQALERRGLSPLLPYLELLRGGLAQLLHRYPVEDEEVMTSLKYLARRLSPIELVEPYVPKLGELLEQGLAPLLERGRIAPEALREACEVLASFIEGFATEGESDRFVAALLGTYPPEEPETTGLILRP